MNQYKEVLYVGERSEGFSQHISISVRQMEDGLWQYAVHVTLVPIQSLLFTDRFYTEVPCYTEAEALDSAFNSLHEWYYEEFVPSRVYGVLDSDKTLVLQTLAYWKKPIKEMSLCTQLVLGL